MVNYIGSDVITFGDCTLDEFVTLCDRLGIAGTNRSVWMDLFKRCAYAAGTRKATVRDKRMLAAFIKEARLGRAS
jgi:hypothetical protein